MTTVLIVMASLCVCLGIVVLLGKGDMLISGYNTASEEEKAKYNVERLRLVTGAVLLSIGPLMLIFLLKPGNAVSIMLSVMIVAICIAGVFLMNTWVKKKD